MNKIHCFARLGLSFLAAGVFAGIPAAPAAADEPSQVLKRITERGAIVLGYREAEFPFSYLDDQQQVQGYAWELCGRVAEAVKARLAQPALPVVPVPVTANDRMIAVRTGTIDLECAATANTPPRQRQVGFSYTTYVGTTRVLVRADSPIRGVSDLNGKRVVTTQGSGSERYVKTAIALRGAEIGFAAAGSHTEAMAMLDAGKADAFVLDDASLAALKASAADPAKYRILDDNLSIESYALMLKREDAVFKQLVDDTLAGLMRSGELEKIYNKWFVSPILPKGINLQLPMSEMLKQIIRNPSDRAG